MDEETTVVDLLRCLLNVTGRAVYPEEKLLAIVSPTVKGRSRAVLAYNLCDGTRGLTQVATEAKIDQGQFSRTVQRWRLAGILHVLGSGKSARLLHVYPLSG